MRGTSWRRHRRPRRRRAAAGGVASARPWQTHKNRESPTVRPSGLSSEADKALCRTRATQGGHEIDLARYYSVSEWMLPHLPGVQLTVARSGWIGRCNFSAHAMAECPI